MHASAICKFLAGAFEHLLEFLLGLLELLLVEEGEGFVVELHLGLDTRVDELDATTLGRMGRR